MWVRERPAVDETSKQAKQTRSRTVSGVRCMQQASSAMTQGLQARNEWGWDGVHFPGTHSIPHQGVVRETLVASRKTLKQRKGKRRGGGGMLEEELYEWVGE